MKVHREPQLSDTVLVNARGEIVLARIGVVSAGRLTLTALEDTLKARYAMFLRNPSVDLVVLRRVSVNGAVQKPDVYYVDVSMTLRDVVALAGGLSEEGSDDRVDLVRNGARTRADRWQEDMSVASDLHSGDEIVVGRRSWLARNALSVASTVALLTSVLVTAVRR